MIKFIPAFSCWKLNNNQVLVIASCAKTHEVCVFIATDSGVIFPLSSEKPMPDVRKLVPCRWHALAAVQRANVRNIFGKFLCDRYGDEGFGLDRIMGACGSCD